MKLLKKQTSLAPVEATTEQPNVVPWGIGSALLVVVGLYFLSQLLAALLISVYPHLQGWTATRTQAWLSDSVAAQFVYILIAETITIGGLILFLRHQKFSLAGIGFKRPRWRDPLFGLLLYLPYILTFAVIVVLAKRFIPGLNIEQEQQIGFDSVQGGWQLVLTGISLVVLPPLTEELLIRGFLFTSLRKYFKLFGAAVITSLVFATAHLPEGGAAGPLYIAAIDTFVLSLYLCWLREKTGSLWAGITLHALKNGIAFVSLFIFASR